MALPFILAGAAIGGIASAFSNAAQARQRNAALGQAIQTLRENLLSQTDIDSSLRNINREFNSATTNVLNSTAIRSRGLANAPTVAAAAGARLQPARINALEGFRTQARSFNAGIFDRISGLQAQTAVSDPVGSFVGGAIQGGIAGAQIGRLEGLTSAPTIETVEAGLEVSGAIPALQTMAGYNRDDAGRAEIPDILARPPQTFQAIESPGISAPEDIMLGNIRIGSTSRVLEEELLKKPNPQVPTFDSSLQGYPFQRGF